MSDDPIAPVASAASAAPQVPSASPQGATLREIRKAEGQTGGNQGLL